MKNPKYQQVLRKYKHVHGVTMDDVSEKTELPVHLLLGATEYAKIKKAQRHVWESQGNQQQSTLSLGGL